MEKKPSLKERLKIDPKTLLVDVIFDIVGCVLYGAGMFNFAHAANFAPGGVTGIAFILNRLTDGAIKIGLGTVLINIPIVLICFKALGLRFFFRSAKTIIFSAVIVDYLMPMLPVYEGEPMLAAIFGGILAGAGLACIYMRDSSTGGSDFVIMAIRKKNPQLSLGLISLAVDGIVILFGGIVYGTIDAALYGLIMTITYSLIIDKIMYGNDSRKLMTIITTKGDDISNRINQDIERGVTVLNGKGAYTGADKNVLLCACSKTEVFKVKRIAHEVDNKSFVMVSSIDAAYGEGFKRHDAQ
ncbi:MAG: YitT family protein [Clostridia bacterium]|nr:YitT family protein [Clostridia bacterium]MBQ2191992.1 YitT family protein [Clostridia bacterium]MBQ3939257.1 YitT family protein [Clostridia bacterium]MBQ5488343.1 YitT family protein [Clostridia bacterium]MBR4635967.1 YitT family protein [Clostridia bacterium]